MPARPVLIRRRFALLRRIAFVLALVAQAVGAFTTVAEGRGGRGAGTHIEGVGSGIHYVHDESTCAACHVRSIHGSATWLPNLEPIRYVESRSFAARGTRPASAEPTSTNPSRAPPVVS